MGVDHKAPSLKQLSLEYITVAAGGRFIITGNPDLKPETSTSYEAGIAYYGTTWHVTATAFQNDLLGLIQTTCVENCGIRGRERRAYVNVEKARIRGTEIGAQWAPVDGLTLSASYTYVDPRNLSTDQELAERPNHSVKWALAWTVMPGSDVNVRGRYIGKQTVYQNSLPVRLDGYQLWSVDVSRDVNERLTLKAGIDNVFKKRLAEDSALYSFAEPGRVLFIGLGASY